MGDKKPMIITGKGRVLTVAELEELARKYGPLSHAAKVAREARDAQEDAEHEAREAAELAQFTGRRAPAHVDPRPTIAPGTVRVHAVCEDCGARTVFVGIDTADVMKKIDACGWHDEPGPGPGMILFRCDKCERRRNE